MMVVGGVANHSFLLTILDLASPDLGGLLSGVPLLAVQA
jgi:hypothetical protein